MLISEIAQKFPLWSRITVAEAWLKSFAKDTSHEDVKSEWGFAPDVGGEYTLSDAQAEQVWSHDWPNGS